MAAETLQPDGSVFELTNMTGAATDIDEGVDSPDGVWLNLVDDATDCIVRASFPTPTGAPNTGADLQKFRLYVRVGTEAGGNDPTMDIAVRETGGGTDLAVQTGISVTSRSGEIIEFTWDASVLGTADGSAVEVYATGQRSGGSPTVRRCVEFDAIEWVANYATSESHSGSGAIVETHTVVATGRKNASGAGSISQGHTVVAAGNKKALGAGSINPSHTVVATGVANELHSGSGAIVETHTVVGAGASARFGAGSISHGHTVVATGFKAEGEDKSGSGAIVESHSVVATGRKEGSGTGNISHGHIIVATGVASELHSGSGVIVESHTVIGEGDKAASGEGAITHPHQIDGQGIKAVSGAGTITHPHTVVGQGDKAVSGIASISRGHTVVATGIKKASGVSSISHGHTVVATGHVGVGRVGVVVAVTETHNPRRSYNEVLKRDSVDTGRDYDAITTRDRR